MMMSSVGGKGQRNFSLLTGKIAFKTMIGNFMLEGARTGIKCILKQSFFMFTSCNNLFTAFISLLATASLTAFKKRSLHNSSQYDDDS